MTGLAAPPGMIAFLQVAAASCRALSSAEATHCRGGREAPQQAPDPPGGCHAAVGCAGPRKLRTIP